MLTLAFAAALLAADAESGTHEPEIRNRKTPASATHLTPPEKAFAWTLEPLRRDAGITVRSLTFPSPLPSPVAR
ncbi:MAG: hypothetical protein JXP34_02945, partial [Planctomycetes bacterium]|nr:hypothetical protein [Planctomycetota bacterium]